MGAVFVDEPHIMGLFWTLEIELVFYFACAFLYLIFGQYKLLSSLVGFAAAFYLWKHDILLQYQGNLPFLAYFLCIMFTTATFRCVYELDTEPLFNRSEKLKTAAKITFAIMVYLVARPVITGIEKSFISDDPVWSKYGWGHTLGLALFAIFFLIKRTPRWLATAGRTTYSAYLLHAIVFTLLLRLWESKSLPHTRLELYILLTTLITFGVAALSFRFVERPSIRLGKSLADKF
ncbi:hypothetical protein VDG1235_335 [Verrucomicrobiia bacterium DG1235]|nr:hypothetical protein VDG1235_335 [Verrucomicrobiae bacterium DG1235]